MLQVLQNLSNGETSLEDVPCPVNISGNILISTRKTILSIGTERMLVDFGKSNLINKARQQPDKVKQVLAKIKTDGFLPTIDAVRSKLDQPITLGYCNAGVILESDVVGYSVGDRIVSNGNHAEVVRVAKNLCAKIPDNVDDESAAFTVLAAIGLQSIRLISPTLGESVVVIGLGLVGLITVQMLIANGCRVLAIDMNSKRCELAREFGAQSVNLSENEDPIAIAKLFSRNLGVDAVIVAASSQSDEIMHQAAEICRKRGRIVLVGVVGLNLRRDDFFKKEITFQVSASYGPGRYDTLYEQQGQDYPIGFVRWTEQRNFEAVLDMMSTGTLNLKPLITHRFKITHATDAYKILNDPLALGIVLDFPNKSNIDLKLNIIKNKLFNNVEYLPTDVVVGFIGAGNYASRTLIPAFKKAGAKLNVLASSGGVSGFHHSNKYGFCTTTTDINNIWTNDQINTVAIVTRHDAHANQVITALKSGKNVFIEKPLAITLQELKEIDSSYQSIQKSSPCKLMIGFNRRFAPHIIKMKQLLDTQQQAKVIIMTINAGSIPSDHWTQDLKIGGGRIIGEACHFIDLMRFLIGYSISDFQSIKIGAVTDNEITNDKVSINLSFTDGSIATIHYLANGGVCYPKERIEVFCNNAVLQLDNYRVLKSYGWKGFSKMKLVKQDKGQQTCALAFVDSIKKASEPPIPYNELMEVSRISIEIANQLN